MDTIIETGTARYNKWREIGNNKAVALYERVRTRRVNGVGFLGHGSWDRYLQKVHLFFDVNQRHWSDVRFHASVAAVLPKFPPEKIGWATPEAYAKVAIAGRSLGALYRSAYDSNHRGRANGVTFFGQGSWKNYVNWVRKRRRVSLDG
ncbi:MAG: hypothetical protein V1722_01970 [Candidatus Micrarchaeota archaeon]